MGDMNNLKLAMMVFQEEVEGAGEYEKYAIEVTDPTLKKMFQENAMVEKKHAQGILAWINAASQKVLG